MRNIKIAGFVFLVGILFMVSGVSLALFRENIEGSNKEFITGDIWMKYTGSNQLVINDMTPSDGVMVLKTHAFTKYTVNPNMTTDEINACIDAHNGSYFLSWEGENAEDFCRGTGTKDGLTLDEYYGGYRSIYYTTYEGEQLVDLNVLTKGEQIPLKRFIYTSLEYNQDVTEEEINICKQMYFYRGVDEGSTKEDYCRGTGTIDGKTLSERLKDINSLDYYEIVEEYSPFIASNIVKPVVDMPYFEFTIDGKNTYTKKDIIYEIVLNHGADHETRGTRIKDEDLQFTLIEVDEDGNYVDIFLSKQKYFDLTNKRIWVDTVPANSTTEVNKTYRLYMNIANDTIIGNVNQDYTMDEWNDIYASIKVGVTGDFKEKELETTDERCFEGYEEAIYKYNENITEDGVNACIEYYGGENWEEGETADAFCRGTGTLYGKTIREVWAYSDYYDGVLAENGVLVVDRYQFVVVDYDENCGGNLIFPETINGMNYKVWTPLYDKWLINVTFSSTMTYIDHEQFSSNPLLDVFVPSNITQVYCASFDDDVNVVYENEGYVCDPDGEK